MLLDIILCMYLGLLIDSLRLVSYLVDADETDIHHTQAKCTLAFFAVIVINKQSRTHKEITIDELKVQLTRELGRITSDIHGGVRHIVP